MPTLKLVQNDAGEATIVAPTAVADDLSRNVFGLLGVPLDAIDFKTLINLIDAAAQSASPFLISTPNVNFLIKSQTNREFRHSLQLSDLCLADGMPLIWIAKLLGIPIRERIAGSDLFGRLRSKSGIHRPLKVFLLGGAEGLAASVGAKLNAERGGLECVGFLNPGFGTIEELSSPEIVNSINASNADLIAVFFGAEKAQAWLVNNHLRLKVTIRAQFGATINFEAGTVRRAPLLLRSTGFEWLWRIKEEPYLWRRYWNDGKALLKLGVSSVLPLMVCEWRMRSVAKLVLDSNQSDEFVTIHLVGGAVAANVDSAIKPFREALNSGKQVILNLSKTRHVDARFFGLFVMLSKELGRRGQSLRFSGVTPQIRRIFRLNRFEFLLSQEV